MIKKLQKYIQENGIDIPSKNVKKAKFVLLMDNNIIGFSCVPLHAGATIQNPFGAIDNSYFEVDCVDFVHKEIEVVLKYA